MKRVRYVVLALVAVGLAQGADQISATMISTEPSGASFNVDGKEYREPMTFLWPEGTKHLLQLPAFTEVAPGIRYTCTVWSDSKQLLQNPGASQEIVADPTISYYKGTCQLMYRLQLGLMERPEEGLIPSCASTPRPPGLVLINNEGCTDHSAEIWYLAGTTVKLEAQPFLDPNDPLTYDQFGYVFLGWTQEGGTADQSYLTTITINGPLQVPVLFRAGKRLTMVTDPPGLDVLVDRQQVTTPYRVDWIDGSKHYLGAPAGQEDSAGNPLVFDSWSYGGGQNSSYTADSDRNFDTLTAKFLPGTRISLLTSPSGLGLKLSVDGTENWTDYNFSWAVGSKHQVAAAQTQVSKQGRSYAFRGWDDGAPAVRDIVVQAGVIPEGLQTAVGYRYTANYELLGRVIVQTSPAGLPLVVDGQSCTAPCTLDKAAGSQVALTAPSWAPWIDGARWNFLAWSDSGALAHNITFTKDVQTVTAVYLPAYRLTTSSDPAGGATFRLNPASADGFYPHGTLVQATAVAQSGFRFRRWDGDLAGTYSTGYLTMSWPVNIVALLDRVPYIAPAGVRNAAAPTPDAVVAAGSIVGIFGSSLTDSVVQAASKSPLPQTLANVTARVGYQFLPLLLVSPTQINAALPSALPEGHYTLTVSWVGHPDVSAGFDVARNAPGLFLRPVDDRALAMANHEDGTPITFDSPARRGETVSLFGTGFGPYVRLAPDGFALPKGTVLPLVDAVTVVAGDFQVQPDWSGAAVGEVGMAVTRFKIADPLPAASTLEVKLRINGRESNTVLLPLE